MPTYRITPDAIDANTITVSAELAHHLTRVLRVKTGEMLRFTDGQGQWWTTEILAIANQQLRCSIQETGAEAAAPHRVTLAAAVLQKERWRFALEKACELGAQHIQPLITARTQQPKITPQLLERWERIIAAAAEQCDRCWYPKLHTPMSFAEALQHEHSNEASQYICVEPYATEPAIPDAKLLAPQDQTVIYIGPEGGWTSEELALARDAGCQRLSLGPQVLRAETAVCAALTRVQSYWWT